MCKLTKKLTIKVFLAFFISLMYSTASFAMGFREMSNNDVNFAVWYPSDSTPSTQRIGPFDVLVAENAPIKDGKYEIVLFSHGYNGFYRNHYLTIQALVQLGYVVISPQHEADYLLGSNDTSASLHYRYLELSESLETVLTSKEFHDHVEDKKVHGVGYSLGSVSIMMASGATFSFDRYSEYCQRNQSLDPNFCEDPGWIYRLLQSFRHDVVLKPTTDPLTEKPLITGKVVLVAPVFQGIDPGSQLSISNLNVFAFDSDQIAMPEYHARPLYKAFSAETASTYRVSNAHHYAFIAPFPKWLVESEDIPVAKDPEGFDRLEFLNNINSEIINAMKFD